MKTKWETVTLIGVCLGTVAVFGGALLEGLKLGSILQLTSAIIVFGGTLGSTLVAFPKQDLKNAYEKLKTVFAEIETDCSRLVSEIVSVSSISRKEGILSLEPVREKIENPLFKKALKYAIDGLDPESVRQILENEINQKLEEDLSAARVWETAGSYAPTIGIIGAVLGLIQIMGSLSDPTRLGAGISVAFVSTVYGVSLSNLICIPFGNKLKRKATLLSESKEIVMVGVLGILEGQNPLFLKEKLDVYLEKKS